MSKTFSAAPVDEIHLAKRVEPVVAQWHGNLPGTRELQAVAATHGLDVATAAFYHAILVSSQYGEFIRQIDSLPAEPVGTPARSKALIIPALFYRQRPEYGGDGQLIASIARACGFEAEVILIDSLGSVTHNALFIASALERETCDDIWLISLSKGGAEVRLVLQTQTSTSLLPKIRGWINICGLVRGSALVDDLLSTPLRGLRARALCAATGIDYVGVSELRTSHPYWRAEFQVPEWIRVINLIGVPLASHVQKTLLSRYKRLSSLGPYDGMALLPELLISPGDIYPVWGADHFFRSVQVSPLLYRVFRHIRGKTL